MGHSSQVCCALQMCKYVVFLVFFFKFGNLGQSRITKLPIEMVMTLNFTKLKKWLKSRIVEEHFKRGLNKCQLLTLPSFISSHELLSIMGFLHKPFSCLFLHSEFISFVLNDFQVFIIHGLEWDYCEIKRLKAFRRRRQRQIAQFVEILIQTI